ncbi:N-6 DNA methylase [Methylocystis iwaonis]|uniref:site-specific DNA-methyltransferase (adenine-specific) n=1 Tax=Methylocystis iwaonis TaxID=2885079 RepID=A0ABM8EG79_9HYPH|nr:N-6 DNA methylase [Methylocystis iwaonis]BDV36690.1 BseRI endonuclease [Methylocystis iwaonis]
MSDRSIFQPAHTEALFNDLRRANTEQAKKERFLQYLSVAFAKDQGAQSLISAIALGAERIVANITRKGRIAKGRADSQTETIIIEWEKDLGRTAEHAREQLEEYLEGNWKSGQEYRFTLLTTDGIRWRRYAPDWSEVEFGKLSFGRDFKLREIRRFDLAEENFSEFPFFLDEVLFSSQPRAATLENIQNDFGDTSGVFINSIACLQACADDVNKKSELQVAYDQWKRFLSIAYGKFDDSPAMFLVHTYLSVFAKFIAYAVITRKPIADDGTITGILDGSVFENLNIERFVEDDFFHWVTAGTYFKRLRPMFRELNLQLNQYDFSDVREDILKGLYQELIDLETRHALGEYYTPDWLCEHVVECLEVEEGSAFLDPACGSGSFLRAIIARMRREFPRLGAEALAEQVVGIDIHPLSVLIAKTTVLLSLGNGVVEAKRPVVLHIYLANSLLVPRGTADLFKTNFQISVDNKNYVLDVKGVEGADVFDQLITFCDEMVGRYQEQLDRDRFGRLLRSVLKVAHASELPGQLFDVYRGMKVAHMQGRDSIWKFILQNSYKPVFLMNRFDFVVGNPPWLTYSAISNGEYQGLLRQVSDGYAVTPQSRANMPHLEIAAIFMAHAVNYFLKPSGKLAFVLPRSFMSADQHDNTRAGVVSGLKLTEAWDLEGVAPLFRVPSCVLFCTRSLGNSDARLIPSTGLPGAAFSGRLPRPQLHWSEAQKYITSETRRWYYSRLQGGRGATRSALTAISMEASTGTNAYASRFSQGATIVPRNFFFVQIDQKLKEDANVRDRVVSIRTSDASDREAKPPWKGQRLSGRTEGKLLFRTSISRNIIPFALVDPPLVVLPVTLKEDGKGRERFTMLDADGLLENGFRYGSAWFSEAEKHWDRSKTDKNREMKVSLSDYLDWQSKLSDQNPKARFLVLYTSSATDASAAVVDRGSFDHPFIVDHMNYWCECSSEAEAHYVCSYINSDYANEKIKDFQARGLFGPRHIHKLILKLPFPKFDKDDADHVALSALGRKCMGLTANFVKTTNVKNLQARALGAVRARLKEQLAAELDAIDPLVEKLSAGHNATKTNVRKKPRRGNGMGKLFDG